jgi:hypothetical protein
MSPPTIPVWVAVVSWFALTAGIVVVPLGIAYDKPEWICSGVALSVYWAVSSFDDLRTVTGRS